MSTRILVGDCRARLAELDAGSVQTCVTSPPYFGLRDYGHAGQIGLEPTPDEYVREMVAVFREVRRVLRDDGTLWLNLGDSYNASPGTKRQSRPGGGGDKTADEEAWGVGERRRVLGDGLKPKDLIGIPWRVAFALQADGWYLRSDIIWAKPNAMPESVRDRPTRSHEYIFLLSKSERYHYDADAIAEDAVTALAPPDANGSTISGGAYGRSVLGDAIPEKDRRVDKQRGHSRRHAGFNDRWDATERSEQNTNGKRNKRDVWTVCPAQFSGAHFATFPPALIEPCILAGCPKDGTVLDPFGGAGTTALVADRLGRNAILCELNPEYARMTEERLRADGGMFSEVTLDAPPLASAAKRP